MAARVSVILPIYNSAKYLSKAIDSVIDQTFTDWELLAINDFGSDDGSADIVSAYAREDSRIRLVQNEERLGLAESLNKGFRMAEGEYLARLDADDLAHPDRFEKQVAFLDAHPQIGVCGTYQHHFGPDTDWVHRPPVTPEDMKATLVFLCNICHSTLMLRRDVFVDNGLFYDSSYYAEDFELWTRAIAVTEFATIPEVLGEYRKGEDNITEGKKNRLRVESGHIVANALKRTLGMDLTEEQARLFQGWENPFFYVNEQHREEMLKDLERTLRDIYARNETVKAFDPESLLNSIASVWKHAVRGSTQIWSGERTVWSIKQVFAKRKRRDVKDRLKRLIHSTKTKLRLKKFKARVLGILRRIYRVLANDSARDIQKKVASISERNACEIKNKISALESRVDEQIEYWIRECYRVKMDMGPLRQAADEYVPYRRGEKIRIGVLFQIPSCWLSLKTVWEALQADERFEAKMYLFDAEKREPARMAGARQFLAERDIPFTVVDRYTFLEEKLHILLYQTPCDNEHRPRWLQSDMIAQLGTRVVSIPCELSYSASVEIGRQFSDLSMQALPWRVFTTTERMRFDHIVLSPYGGNNVVAAGHPRFDALARKEDHPLDPAVRKLAAGRRIVLLQLCAPSAEETPYFPEAEVSSYIEFLRGAGDYGEEFFFLICPQPKMLEHFRRSGMAEEAKELLALCTGAENAYLYDAPDCRPALFAADCVISDRPELLLAAAALDIPVLYMTNFYYREKILPAVEPVFDSFYQGSHAYDIRRFMDFVMRKGNDYKKKERQEAARTCLPPLDGLCGKRIADAMAEAIYGEAVENA